MKRFLTICCSLALLGSAGIALGAAPGTTTKQAVLAKHGLSEFDLDGNGTLDASERAAAVAARNAARHQASLPATGVVTNRNSNSPSTSYANSGRSAGGSILVINPPPSQCPIQNAERNYFNSPHPFSGGSVVAPVNIVLPNGASANSGIGSGIYTAGNDPRIVIPAGQPYAAVVTGPQLPNPNTGASVYWVPNSNLSQQPLAVGGAMLHARHYGR